VAWPSGSLLSYRVRELRKNLSLTQVDTVRRYVEALGGHLRIEIEIELGEERIQIA